METSEDHIIKHAKLIKMKSVKESNFIEVGDTLIGYYFIEPTIGEQFVFWCESMQQGNQERFSPGPFRTTNIVEIIDDYSFRTRNSIYYLIDKINDRNLKIDDILK